MQLGQKKSYLFLNSHRSSSDTVQEGRGQETNSICILYCE